MCKNLSMKSPVLLFPQFWHWTIWHPWWQDPTWSWHSEAPGNSLQFSAREMSAGSDSGGNLFSSRYTLFHMFWAWNPTWCPNFGDWNQLKSSSSWYGSKNEDHWVGDLSPEQLWGGGKNSASHERSLKNGLLWTLCISIILYLTCDLKINKMDRKITYIPSDSMTGGFNRWPGVIDGYNYGGIMVNIHMSWDMNLVSMVKYPIITWTVPPSILVGWKPYWWV